MGLHMTSNSLSLGQYLESDLVVIETNIDDMNPEFFPSVMNSLLESGAKDSWLTPIIMKHGRPAHCLSVLCSTEEIEKLIHLIFSETTTIGVRVLPSRRYELSREFVRVETAYGEVTVKVASDKSGTILNAAPEYRDCEKIARERGVPVKEIYRAAQILYAQVRKDSSQS